MADGRTFRAVKVPHVPAVLEQRLRALGWNLAVRMLVEPFFWGEGSRA